MAQKWGWESHRSPISMVVISLSSVHYFYTISYFASFTILFLRLFIKYIQLKIIFHIISSQMSSKSTNRGQGSLFTSDPNIFTSVGKDSCWILEFSYSIITCLDFLFSPSAISTFLILFDLLFYFLVWGSRCKWQNIIWWKTVRIILDI